MSLLSLIRLRPSASRIIARPFYRHMGSKTNEKRSVPSVEIDKNLANHFSKPYKFVPIAAQTFYCKDSRGDVENFGAPGGDFGEFLLALDSFYVLEKSQVEIDDVFGKWLNERCSPSRPFYLHTDRPALTRLFEAIGEPEVSHPRDLKDPVKQELFAREFGCKGDYQGCGHLRLILESTCTKGAGDKNYEIGCNIFSSLSGAFFKRFFAGDDRLLFKIYENVQDGRALAVISGPSSEASKMSLLGTQQLSQNDQVFILNQHAVSAFRRQFLVPFFTKLDGSISAEEMYERMEGKGWRNAMLTANTLAGGKPIYHIKLEQE